MSHFVVFSFFGRIIYPSITNLSWLFQHFFMARLFSPGPFEYDIKGRQFLVRYKVIRAFSDFKAFLYILIGGFSVRGCYHIKTPNFPLPCGRGPTSLPSWTENIVYLAKTLYFPPYLACWNIHLSTEVIIQIKFSDMRF